MLTSWKVIICIFTECQNFYLLLLQVIANFMYGFGYSKQYADLYMDPETHCNVEDFDKLLQEFDFLEHHDSATHKSILNYYSTEFNVFFKRKYFCIVSNLTVQIFKRLALWRKFGKIYCYLKMIKRRFIKSNTLIFVGISSWEQPGCERVNGFAGSLETYSVWLVFMTMWSFSK